MSRRLIRSLALSIVAIGSLGQLRAANTPSPVLLRYFALDDPVPRDYKALRHLDASNDKFEKSAWMDVLTEADASGFRYRIVCQGGSEYIRSKVFVASLETERKMWASGEPDRAGITLENYVFEDRGEQSDGLTGMAVKPRRKGVLFFEGSIFLRPDDGELMRIEGRLSKSPSFWTRRIEIVRWYGRFAGVRMPVALESVANVLIAGRSNLRMSYEYEIVNGQRVGTPVPRSLNASASR